MDRSPSPRGPAGHGGPPLPAGVTAGHWTDVDGGTGCTVILAPGGAVAGVDVRGGAPGTLGTDALRPGRLVERAHAILLAGGSAFGLDAAAGIMRYLEERGAGFAIGAARVPIVAGAVIFDLMTGDPRARPDAAAGYAACEAADADPAAGRVGAGTGATVAKAGQGPARPGGLGIASGRAGGTAVAAIMVANSVGGIWDDERCEWVAPLAHGALMREPGPAAAAPGPGGGGPDRGAERGPLPGASTTIGAVVTDAALTREQANRVAAAAHDGIARAVRPAHTRFDGDTVFCLATGAAPASADAADLVEALAADLVARAIALGVRAAAPGSAR